MEFQLDQYKDNLLCLYEGEVVKRNICNKIFNLLVLASLIN